jgi:carbonic anhydrase
MPQIGGWVTTQCGCCGTLLCRTLGRRSILKAAGGAAAAFILQPLAVVAAVDAEALVLSCIDPRVQDPLRKYLDGRGLTGQYNHFAIAGAAIAVVSPVFSSWRKAFWDNVALSVQLNRIKKIIAVDHRDCDAAKLAYRDSAVATPAAETKTHQRALLEFRKQVGQRQPKLAVETALMALDGSVEMIG